MAQEGSQAAVQAKVGFLNRLHSEFGFIRGNFLILVLSWILMDFAREMPSTYYGLYVRALGGSAATIGLIGFVSMIAQSLVQFPGGYLADKYGRKWLISTMTFGVALSYAFYALASSWQTIMLGAIISSLCMIYNPALNAMIMDSLPQDRRGMGFSIMNLINSVSTTPAPLIAGWLFMELGLIPSMRVGYGLVVVAFLVAGVLRFRLEETVKEPATINGRELAMAFPRSVTEGMRVWETVPRSALILFITVVIVNFSYSLFQPVLLLYIVDDLGISEVNWAIIMTVLFVSMIALAIPLGKLIDRVGKKGPLLVSYLIWILIMPLLLYGDFFKLLVGMPVIGVLQILGNAGSSALFADLIPKENRGKVSGSMRFFTLVASAFGNLVGGFMYDDVSHTLPFLSQIVFITPVLLLTLIFIKEPKKDEINGA